MKIRHAKHTRINSDYGVHFGKEYHISTSMLVAESTGLDVIGHVAVLSFK